MNIQEAIEILREKISPCVGGEWKKSVDMAISALQAQDVPDTNVGDMISRKAAIDAIEHRLAEPAYQHTGEDWYVGMNCAESELYELPSAQPEPCEDAVSRTDVFNAIRGEERGGYVDVTVEYMLEVMSNLPSVKPDVTHCGDCENSDC